MSEGDPPVISIDAASKRFPAPEVGFIHALRSVSLEVGANEFITLLGPSGCGKTTLLRAISGFEDLDAGTVTIDGRPMTHVPPYRRPVNTVFQNYALFPHLSIGDNIGYGLDVTGCPRAERDTRVAEALELVGLAGCKRRNPRQLSGGQQQRVALARAIVNRPKVLLLDEPLSALDKKLREAMQSELKKSQHEVGIVGRQPEELAPPTGTGHRPPGQYRLEVPRPLGLAPHGAWVQHVDIADPHVLDMCGQPPADDLHLGQLRHQDSPDIKTARASGRFAHQDRACSGWAAISRS